jgi:hypothetical protein
LSAHQGGRNPISPFPWWEGQGKGDLEMAIPDGNFMLGWRGACKSLAHIGS